MTQGIGVRFTSHGIRVLKLAKENDNLTLLGIAAGMPGENLDSFAAEHKVSLDDAQITCGLGPGDFIVSGVKRENDMDDEELQKHLRWEAERKIISDVDDYIYDFSIVGDIGYIFAGRKQLINKISGSADGILADVEPIALFNGCEGVGELGKGTIMLISIEAEGISSVIVENSQPVSMESFPMHEDEIVSVLMNLNEEDIENIDNGIIDGIANYVCESIERLTSLGENKENPSPDKLVLAGGGAYAGEFADMIGKKYGIDTVISDPFARLQNDVKEITPELAGKSAAFTTCFGLALRAMEV